MVMKMVVVDIVVGIVVVFIVIDIVVFVIVDIVVFIVVDNIMMDCMWIDISFMCLFIWIVRLILIY